MGKWVRDPIGLQFGKWKVLSEIVRSNPSKRDRVVVCECSCHAETLRIIRLTPLRAGKTKSCGCDAQSIIRAVSSRHSRRLPGIRSIHPRLYRVYSKMKSRCCTVSDRAYPDYGERGIKICQSWLDGFAGFARDMLPGYENHLTLDRIDVNGDYCKTNCRWATVQEQQKNKRNNRWVTLDGERMILCDAATKLGICRYRLREDLNKSKEIEVKGRKVIDLTGKIPRKFKNKS